MIDISERATELAFEGYCCSQIMISIGLEIKGKENPELVQAMKALCFGSCTQRLCGTLNAAACLLSLYHEQYGTVLIPQLFKWFEERFGSVNCGDLIGHEKRDTSKCLELTVETCNYCFELLEENDLLSEE